MAIFDLPPKFWLAPKPAVIRAVSPAKMAMLLTGAGGPFGGTAAAPAYTGPGDVVSSALAWWGLRAYNAAYATGSNPCIDVCDSTSVLANPPTTTINVLSNGNLDVTTIASLGYYPNVGLLKIYDQTGNGWHLTQTIDHVRRPLITLSAIGSLPGITFSGSNSQGLINVSSFSQAQPYTISAVAAGDTAANQSIFTNGNTTYNGLYMDVIVEVYAGTVLSGSAVSGTQAIQGIFNGGSSVAYVNGSSTSGNAGSTAWSSTGANQALDLGNDDGSGTMKGNIYEVGIWGSGFNGTQQSNMNSNQRTYWGF